MTIKLTPDRRRRRRLALTPLIDVVFLLLVFFILGGRFEQHNHLTLASGAEDESAAASLRPQILRLFADGTVQLGREALTPAGVRERISAAGNAALILAPQQDVDIQTIVTWVDDLRVIGIDDVSFLAPAAR